MITVACYNIKGGVGKTAAAVNLAYLAAQGGANTLVWDLDPQGAASFYFRIKPRIKGGSFSLFQRKRRLDDVIKATDYPRLDLVPADFSYRNMDLLLERAAQARYTTEETHQAAEIRIPFSVPGLCAQYLAGIGEYIRRR